MRFTYKYILTLRWSPGVLETPKEVYHIKVLTDASTVQIKALIDCHMFQCFR